MTTYFPHKPEALNDGKTYFWVVSFVLANDVHHNQRRLNNFFGTLDDLYTANDSLVELRRFFAGINEPGWSRFHPVVVTRHCRGEVTIDIEDVTEHFGFDNSAATTNKESG